MVVFLKCESETEDDQYCQPRCHSPGSASMSRVDGLLPLRRSAQLGFSVNPCLSKVADASRRWAKHSSCGTSCPHPLSMALQDCVDPPCASAQEAQYATVAQRVADLKPKPPMRIGRDATCLACSTSPSVPGSCQSEPELCPICLRHAVDCTPRTKQAAECATCGWLWGWYSATRLARHTANLGCPGLPPTAFVHH